MGSSGAGSGGACGSALGREMMRAPGTAATLGRGWALCSGAGASGAGVCVAAGAAPWTGSASSVFGWAETGPPEFSELAEVSAPGLAGSAAAAPGSGRRRRRTITLGCGASRSPLDWALKCSRRRAAPELSTEPATLLTAMPSSRPTRTSSLGCAPSSAARSFTLIFSSAMLSPLGNAPGAASPAAPRHTPASWPETRKTRRAGPVRTEIPAPAWPGLFRIRHQSAFRGQHMARQLGLRQPPAADHAHAHGHMPSRSHLRPQLPPERLPPPAQENLWRSANLKCAPG